MVYIIYMFMRFLLSSKFLYGKEMEDSQRRNYIHDEENA